MAEAFAAAVKTVAERTTSTHVEAEDRAERYFFFAGDEPGVEGHSGMLVASPCIPNKMFRRCEVTPCMTIPVWARVQDIPEGRMIPGSYNEGGTDRKGRKLPNKCAQYWLFSGPEAQELLHNYGAPDDTARQWGLVELKSLRGQSIEEVAALQLTRTFFPNFPSVPDTNAGVMAQIKASLEDIQTNPNISSKLREIYTACAADMLRAVEQAQAFQSGIVASSNIRVTLDASSDRYKPEFDAKDKLFSVRAGIQLAMNSLRGNQNDSQAQFAKVAAEVMAKMGEQAQPQPSQSLDPNAIAAIVAATMKAMKEQEAAETPKVEAPKPLKTAPKQAQPTL